MLVGTIIAAKQEAAFIFLSESFVSCTSLLVWVLICRLLLSTPAGSQSSGQYETAGVYELQSQVVRDAPQEVNPSYNNN